MRGIIFILAFLALFSYFVSADDCDGCLTENECLDVGDHKHYEDTFYYCDSDSEMKPVKELGESCDKDYECDYYFCNKGACNKLVEGYSSRWILIGVLIFLKFIFGIVLFFVYRSYRMLKKLSKEEAKMIKEESFWMRKIEAIEKKIPFKKKKPK